jgi:hypothetical protein
LEPRSKARFQDHAQQRRGLSGYAVAIKRHIQNVRREGPGTISFVYYSGYGTADPDTKINYLIPSMLPMQKRPLSCGTGAGGDLLTQLGGLLVPRRLFAGALLCGLAFPFGLLLFGSLLGAQFF